VGEQAWGSKRDRDKRVLNLAFCMSLATSSINLSLRKIERSGARAFEWIVLWRAKTETLELIRLQIEQNVLRF
jgi:hypothetical protein